MTGETVLHGNAHALKQGSWVYTDQGVASEHGFNHVSKLWYPQTISYEDGIEQITKAKRERQDIITNAAGISFGTKTGKDFEVSIDGQKFTPNDHSARQLCNWFSVPQTLWTYYMRKDRTEGDVAVLLNAFRNGREFTYNEPKDLLFRTYKDGTLRGVMSKKYSCIPNEWYVELLKKFIPDGRLSHWRGDADTVFGNVLIPDTIRTESDSDYGGMLSVSNCEIGRRVVSQLPSIFRAICMNGCIWGQTKGIEMRQRHIHIKMEQLEEMVRENIHKQIPLVTTAAQKLIDTHSLKADAGVALLFAVIAKQNALGSEVAGEMISQWNLNSQEKTAFGIVDAVTRTGQKFSNDVWVKCDEIGGTIVREGVKGWDRLNGFAKLMSEKEMNKVYGVAV